jgi:AAA+ ATPase superfamily predicted ATPase
MTTTAVFVSYSEVRMRQVARSSGFIGRKLELERLYKLKNKKTASLIVIRGRRRIGKSALAFEFGKTFKTYVEIQGLNPSEGSSNQDQLNHFAEKLSQIFNSKKEHFYDWTDALYSLVQKTKSKGCLILLDEISWMGKYDPMFPAKIKEAWDTGFKKNPDLNLILCGSVSHWIEEHIIKNHAYEGRISFDLVLQELTLPEINQFWNNANAKLGSFEKMMVLSITGGVPKYLEEVLYSENIEQNILRLCFSPGEFLFEEYEKIFTDIFQRKSQSMEKIIRAICEKKRSPIEISRKLKTEMTGAFTENLRYLELAGFISRDYSFNTDNTVSKTSQIRLRDNYLRFYLKYIEPLRLKILKGGKKISSISELPQFESIMGMQFENLILGNRNLILQKLGITNSQIVTAAPYYQVKSSRNNGSCQVDLLIHTKLDVFYLSEMKCKKMIDKSIIKEVQKKEHAIKLPKRSSLKPVLIYEGEIYPGHQAEIENYFYAIIHFADLFF